tara:strand:- start:175 stop:393 length:219 start_codon:yes stop_codon:yes gene_type:complete
MNKFQMKVEGDRAGEAMEMIANLFDLLEQQESQLVEIASLKQSLERIEKSIEQLKLNLDSLCTKSVETAAKE